MIPPVEASESPSLRVASVEAPGDAEAAEPLPGAVQPHLAEGPRPLPGLRFDASASRSKKGKRGQWADSPPKRGFSVAGRSPGASSGMLDVFMSRQKVKLGRCSLRLWL